MLLWSVYKIVCKNRKFLGFWCITKYLNSSLSEVLLTLGQKVESRYYLTKSTKKALFHSCCKNTKLIRKLIKFIFLSQAQSFASVHIRSLIHVCMCMNNWTDASQATCQSELMFDFHNLLPAFSWDALIQ